MPIKIIFKGITITRPGAFAVVETNRRYDIMADAGLFWNPDTGQYEPGHLKDGKQKMMIPDGADEALGAKADAAVTNPASSGGVIALLKGIISKLAGTLNVSVIGSLAMQTLGQAIPASVILGGYSDGANIQAKRVESVFKPVSSTNLAAATAATIWTPAAGKKIRLMRISIGPTATGPVHLRMGAAGSGVIKAIIFLQGNTNTFVDFGHGIIANNANDILEIYNTSAGAITYNLTACGTEE